jgi:hypothetical protein
MGVEGEKPRLIREDEGGWVTVFSETTNSQQQTEAHEAQRDEGAGPPP